MHITHTHTRTIIDVNLFAQAQKHRLANSPMHPSTHPQTGQYWKLIVDVTGEIYCEDKSIHLYTANSRGDAIRNGYRNAKQNRKRKCLGASSNETSVRDLETSFLEKLEKRSSLIQDSDFHSNTNFESNLVRNRLWYIRKKGVMQCKILHTGT